MLRVPGTDEWYIAYHRFAIPGGDGMHRETTIDKLNFTRDGAIAPIVPTLERGRPTADPRTGLRDDPLRVTRFSSKRGG
jgi:hypothetical protein